MKKLIFIVSATMLFTTFSFGQSNNPYYKTGTDILAAANVISKDYKDGKLKDISQATIDNYYKNLLPGYQTVKLEDFTKIVSVMKNATSDSAIKNSGMSEQAKEFLRKSLTDYSTTALVDDVKKSKIAEDEKKHVLIVLAINYNLSKSFENKKANSQSAKGPNIGFDIDFNDADLAVSHGITSQIWGVVGVVVGYAICGPGCAIAGGIIGLIIGTFPGTTTVHTSNGSHSYTNGHPQP